MMNTIKNIAKTAERAINEPTDYLNEVDNLMYCGKCHTPRQSVIQQIIRFKFHHYQSK